MTTKKKPAEETRTLAASPGVGKYDVRYSLAVYVGEGRVSSLKVGQRFSLAILVQDIRANRGYKPSGVFAAYVSVFFNDGMAHVNTGDPSHVAPTSPYLNGLNSYLWPDGIHELGGFAGFSPTGLRIREVCRVSMTAGLEAGELEFIPTTEDCIGPGRATLLYGVPGVDYPQYPKAVPIERIECVPLKIAIE